MAQSLGIELSPPPLISGPPATSTSNGRWNGTVEHKPPHPREELEMEHGYGPCPSHRWNFLHRSPLAVVFLPSSPTSSMTQNRGRPASQGIVAKLRAEESACRSVNRGCPPRPYVDPIQIRGMRNLAPPRLVWSHSSDLLTTFSIGISLPLLHCVLHTASLADRHHPCRPAWIALHNAFRS
jgi:hypothetical protein